MQELSTRARVSDLRAEIDAIANCPKANGETAAKTAVALVAAYPSQQAHDPIVAKAYMRQLTELLMGQDLDVLQALLGEFVRKHKFLPAVAEVADFIDSKMEPKRSRIGWYLDEIKAIEDRQAEEQVTPEERTRRADMLRNVSMVIRETAKATQRASSTLGPLPQVERTMEEREASIAEMQAGVK